MLKQCGRCKEWKPATFEYFHKNKTKKDGLNHWCKKCMSINHAKHKDRDNKNSKNWYGNNKDYAGEYRQKYHKEHPEVARKGYMKRRNIKINIPYDYTEEDEQYAFQYWNYKCAICKKELDLTRGNKSWAMDHWIPLSNLECPGTVPENMLPLCHGIEGCNNKKHDNNPIEWLNKTFSKEETERILQEVTAFFNSVRKIL